jgi:flagellar motor switch protein FliM
MTDATTLTGDEVAALMGELDEAAEERSGGPQTHVFGADAARPLAAIPALDRMGERAARLLKSRVEPISRIKPRVKAEPVIVRRFDNWAAEQPNFTSLALYRFRPLKGGLLIAIAPDLVSRLVDAFYGGPGIHSERVVKEFTPTEERLLARLSEALIETLTEVWSEVMPAKAQLISRETSTAHAALVAPDQPVAIARFSIGFGGNRTSAVDIVYPVVALRAIEAQLSAKIHDDSGMSTVEWRERMADALGDVRIKARSVLARPTLSVAELLELQAGDVIPVSLPERVPLLISGRQIAWGRIGEQDGRAALLIEKVEGRK